MSGGAREACPAKTLHLMLRQCAEALEAGGAAEQVYEHVSEVHGYGAGWLRSKHKAARAGLPVDAKPRGGVHSLIMDEEVDTILCDIVHEHSAYELAEMCERLEVVTGGLAVAPATISRALKRCGLTLKKKTTVQQAKYTQDNMQHTREYIDSMKQRPAHSVCYFDETMVSSRDLQGRAKHWSPAGTPAFSVEPTMPNFKLSCAALSTIKSGFPALLVRVDKDSTLGGDVADFFY
jgi:transposase